MKVEDKMYCNTKYENRIHSAPESEPNSLRPQTCGGTLSSSYPQTCGGTLSSSYPQTWCRCTPAFSSLTRVLVQLRQKLILKVGVVNSIKIRVTMNLIKWAFKNRLAKVWQVLNISQHQQNYVHQMLAFLQKVILIPPHIKIYLFTINSSEIHKLVTTCNDILQQLYQLLLKS